MVEAHTSGSRKTGKTESILAKSAHGAKFLIALQVASRGLTFAVNQILLRFISPEVLGIATQLEIYEIAVLQFARESLRLAIQRQTDVPSNASDNFKDAENDADPSGHRSQAAEKSQAVVNMAYISLVLGLLLAPGIGHLYFWKFSSSVVGSPYFRESLAFYACAAILELASEPCFVVAQQKSAYKIRAAAESCGTILRCLVTCGLMILASRKGLEVGVMPFAIGQLAFALGVFMVYYSRVAPIAKYGGFSLLPRTLAPKPETKHVASYLSAPLVSLATSLFFQGILKFGLTQGDGLMISLMASLPAQGMYALVTNYGGLVARLLFQPIEESSRNYFGKLLSNIDVRPPRASIQSASRNLTRLLRIYSLLSVCAVVVGPPAAPILLKLVVGSRWSDNGAGELLAKYCFYIPLLAFNGVLESFVSVVATQTQLWWQSVSMVGFFLAYTSAGYILLHQLDLGATGLVYANMANMFVRIIWCSAFIKKYLRQNNSTIETSDVLPTWSTMALAAGTLSILYDRRLQHGKDGLDDMVLLGSISACFLILLTVFERKFIKQCYQSTRTPDHQLETER